MSIHNDYFSHKPSLLVNEAREKINEIHELSKNIDSHNRDKYNGPIRELNQILAALVQKSSTEDSGYDYTKLKDWLNEKPRGSLLRPQPSLVELLQEDVFIFILSGRHNPGQKQPLLESLQAYQSNASVTEYFCHINRARINFTVTFLSDDNIRECFVDTLAVPDIPDAVSGFGTLDDTTSVSSSLGSLDASLNHRVNPRSPSELDTSSIHSSESFGSAKSYSSDSEDGINAEARLPFQDAPYNQTPEDYSPWAKSLVQEYERPICATLGGFLQAQNNWAQASALKKTLSRSINPIRSRLGFGEIQFEAHDLFAKYTEKNDESKAYLDEYHNQINERLSAALASNDESKVALWQYMCDKVINKKQQLGITQSGNVYNNPLFSPNPSNDNLPTAKVSPSPLPLNENPFQHSLLNTIMICRNAVAQARSDYEDTQRTFVFPGLMLTDDYRASDQGGLDPYTLLKAQLDHVEVNTIVMVPILHHGHYTLMSIKKVRGNSFEIMMMNTLHNNQPSYQHFGDKLPSLFNRILPDNSSAEVGFMGNEDEANGLQINHRRCGDWVGAFTYALANEWPQFDQETAVEQGQLVGENCPIKTFAYDNFCGHFSDYVDGFSIGLGSSDEDKKAFQEAMLRQHVGDYADKVTDDELAEFGNEAYASQEEAITSEDRWRDQNQSQAVKALYNSGNTDAAIEASFFTNSGP